MKAPTNPIDARQWHFGFVETTPEVPLQILPMSKYGQTAVRRPIF